MIVVKLSILNDRKKWLVIGLVGFFIVVALWLRLIPLLTSGHTDILSMVASDDPQYDLRLVELSLANHFQYPWFDPMRYFPVGYIDLLGAAHYHYCRYLLHDHRGSYPAGDYRDLSPGHPPVCSRNRWSDVFCGKSVW